ncbi:hypothetical protein BGW39_006928 [Mortierella sp. 14UC]|nr:hypothetical protein BGW39_006928 [Mortierella sp. 14UC]
MSADTPTHPAQPSECKCEGPLVLIVGAGAADLFLAILLGHAGIPYQVYERAKEVKPLGAIMSLNAGVFPALEQLGLYEDLLKITLHSGSGFKIYNGDLDLVYSLNANIQHVVGYNHVVFARPEFYDLLLAQIPRDKIHVNKKLTTMERDKEGVTIHYADGASYRGDILIGADGAYSGVRQALYKIMFEKGTLPPSDGVELNRGFICMVGTTRPLDPVKYPGVDEEIANCNQIIGKSSNYCWSSFSVPGNRIYWNVVLQLSTVEESTPNKFKNSEWGGNSSDPMIKEVRDFRIPLGNNTLGDLIDATPEDNISKVFMEEKLFDTWNHGRVVLIGDSCHKLPPSAGLGAVTFMQDSVVLANCLYEMRGDTLEEINAAIHEFKEKGYTRVEAQYEANKMDARLIYGQSIIERILRTVVFNWLPESVKLKESVKGLDFRPQASFLPQIPAHGTLPVLPQKVSQRYLDEQGKQKATVAV